MKRIILCEGKIDSSLIGYFLKKKLGWSFLQSPPIKLFEIDQHNEVLDWYQHTEKKDQELAIWGVGGITQIAEKLKEVVDRTRNERDTKNRFEKIVLFFDRDTNNDEECIELVKKWVGDSKLEVSTQLKFGVWTKATAKLADTSKKDYPIEMLIMVLPPWKDYLFDIDIKYTTSLNNNQITEDMKKEFKEKSVDISNAIIEIQETDSKWLIKGKEQYVIKKKENTLNIYKRGNLEIFLLDALRNSSNSNQCDRLLVDKAGKFIAEIPDNPYLYKQSLRDKAHLGGVLSVISPDGNFKKLDERLRLVDWEKLESCWEVFKKLEYL